VIGRREFITLLGGAGAACPLAARAQHLANLRAVGYLTPSSSAEAQPFARVFFDALSELRWNEGQNIVVERRYGDDRLERLQQVAAERKARRDEARRQGTRTQRHGRS
jgi:putative ABC transport system substrate-binding protein